MDSIRIPVVQYAELANVYYLDGDSQIIESDQIVPGSQVYDSNQIIDRAMVIDRDNVMQGVPIIDGSSLRNSDGTYIQGVTIYNADQNSPAQNNFYGSYVSGVTGVIDIESANMGIGSNQLTSLDSTSYKHNMNYSTSNNISNNIENTDGDYRIMNLTSSDMGYTNYRNSSLDDDDSDMKLKLDAPSEIANVENFVMQNMPDMENIDALNFEFDLNAIDTIDSEENFPGLELGNVNLTQDIPQASGNTVNSGIIQHKPNSTSSTVPRITIRTKRTRKPRNIIKDDSSSLNLSTISYPPLEMLGISTPNTVQVSNSNIEYNTPIPRISPIYKEESHSQSYSSPVSPSSSTSSYSSPDSPSSGSNSMKPRASLASMTDAERYRHIRNQNNESSRIYRQKKKMSIKEAESELLLLQERNTKLKEVFDAIKQKKELAHTLMKGFVQDASRQRRQ